MANNGKFLFFLLISFVFLGIVNGQEALVSTEEQYYDFLALEGLTERPYLNYRTLSDSNWIIPSGSEHPWQDQNLGMSRYFFDNKLKLKIYGPEWFSSVNTATPYGQNDGALWQGKGYNTSLTGGIRFEAYGVELTLKPQLTFSQNLAFEYIESPYLEPVYDGKAGIYGYYGVRNVDVPQRFGDKPFFTYDWGDSEVRYSWKTLTVGFGTQPIWLGPAQINPIIHSNNAPSYPKLDLGLRRQPMTLPWLNWYIGDIETRAWWGYLSESDYFDNNSDNDHNLVTGFSLAYSFPALLKGLTIGMNRIMLSKWEAKNYRSLLTLLIPTMDTSAGYDENDQRASIVVDYLFPVIGLDLFFEWARNDFSPGNPLVYPFHTEAYTVGLTKTINFKRNLYGEILFELTKLEATPDYIVSGGQTTFYSHHLISHGHTNGGQWLGAGIGTGGNSQFIGFKLIYKKGYGLLFLQRQNPDLDYFWFIENAVYPDLAQNTYFDFGISGMYFITHNLSFSGTLVFRHEEYFPKNGSKDRHNQYFSMSIKYQF